MRLELSRRGPGRSRRHSRLQPGGVRRGARRRLSRCGGERVPAHNDFPEIGAAHPAVRPLTRSLGCQQHRIFYEVGADTILIVRILHKAMDVERHL